ncbi:hypothetical protein [Xylophilus rhododendri]|uniref:hypothetical protein n=1 Tax=Xylophilus rhododendri TaxID=2697032 RepID=UPI001E4E97C4|nr:hypothetical protein [Xylophilus rhododendri]
MSPRLIALPLIALLLAGCEIPGMEPDPRIAQREADAKATGGACRYSLRGIEDCYSLNPKASKSAVFAGWKEMDAYMRENKITGQASAIAPVPAAPAPTVDAEASIDKDTEKVVAPRKSKAKAAPL